MYIYFWFVCFILTVWHVVGLYKALQQKNVSIKIGAATGVALRSFTLAFFMVLIYPVLSFV